MRQERVDDDTESARNSSSVSVSDSDSSTNNELTASTNSIFTDLFLNSLSAGSGAMLWKSFYEILKDNLQKEYFADRPEISDAEKYFGHSYFWATNLVLGAAGSIGFMSPRTLFSRYKGSSDWSNTVLNFRYNFFVALCSYSLFQTVFDATWYIATHFYEDYDTEYPADFLEHAVFRVMLCMIFMIIIRHGSSAIADFFSNKESHHFVNDVFFAISATGLMLSEKQTDKADDAHHHLAIPIALGAAAGARLVADCIRYRKKIHAQGSALFREMIDSGAQIFTSLAMKKIFINTMSSAVGAAIWQFAYYMMKKNLEEKYFANLPSIADPKEYFGNRYYWFTNLILGVSGAIGSILPNALWGDNINKKNFYNFLISFIPEALFCTIYDAAWQATTDMLGKTETTYPTDTAQHAIVNSLIFVVIASVVYALGNQVMSKIFNHISGSSEYIIQEVTYPGLGYGLGLMRFMLGTKQLANASGYLQLPVAFISGAIPRVVYETLWAFNENIQFCNNTSSVQTYSLLPSFSNCLDSINRRSSSIEGGATHNQGMLHENRMYVCCFNISNRL